MNIITAKEKMIMSELECNIKLWKRLRETLGSLVTSSAKMEEFNDQTHYI